MIDGVIPSGQGLAEPFGAAGGALASNAAPGAASLAFDPDEYLPMLADHDLTEAQAREFLAALWSIMRTCVELGIKHDVCGQLGFDALPVLSSPSASLDSLDQT